jgi:nucleoside-diphosphate-sugar epimerase
MYQSLELYKNKTILITGAAGFIGSHIVDRLLDLGTKIIGIDNLITGNMNNLVDHWDADKNQSKNINFSFINADINQSYDRYLPLDQKIDFIFHFASPASPPKYQLNPVETYLVNSWATHQLLDYLRHHNPNGRLIFAGTSEAYGNPLEHPQKESYWGNVNPNGVRSCYDESKRLGETICGVHTREFDIDTRIVRIFNTYGPRMDLYDGRVIPNLILKILEKKPMSIYGDGEQTRSYCYVDDLVEGVLRLGSIQNAKGETVNIGNPSELTINQTAKIISELMGGSREPVLDYQGLPEDDPLRRCPDITKAISLLDWRPTTNFSDGLKPTIEFFRSVI